MNEKQNSQTYAIVIDYEDQYGIDQSIVIETVHNTNVTASSSLTQSPMANGSIISDHMYKEPIDMSFSGTFSLNGKQSSIVNKNGIGLANVEEVFEEIKNNNYVCSLKKVMSVGNVTKFKTRNNMVLQSISWTERINSLDFSFTWKQVMLANIIEATVDYDDNFLPNINLPTAHSFTDVLLDEEAVIRQLVNSLLEAELISEEWLNFWGSAGKSYVGAAIGVALAAILFNPIGAYAAAIIVGAVFLFNLGKSFFNLFNNNKYIVDKFELFDNDKKNEEELKRFNDLVEQIYAQLSELNSAISVHGFAQNEEQELYITLNGDNYIFKFTKNNTNDKYELKLYDVNEHEIGSLSDITSVPNNFGQCSSSNDLLNNATTSFDYGIYILSAAATDEEKLDLTKYYVVSTKIDPTEFDALMTEIIKNALRA